MSHNRKISVTGLGYVGLPVAVAFGKLDLTIGFDISRKRIEELKKKDDSTGEVAKEDLASANILFTDKKEYLKRADFHIVAVPTPIDKKKEPDLAPLLSASQIVGSVLKKGDIVVYESTVYPGATEEICAAILEKASGLKCGIDFKLGYSPERINPGDKEHSFSKIRKVVSAQDDDTLDIVANVYEQVVKPGVHKASCIKVAEAAKIIENTQRDINIALMNELALIFDKMNIDTKEVLEAAGTKWNFLSFQPGLVGGHCIGVDPYYLTYKAEKSGYDPQVILAGRKINDSMGKFIAERTIEKMKEAGHDIESSIVTILGITFKENCPDIRNSKVIDIVSRLESFGAKVQICDPYADRKACEKEYEIFLDSFENLKPATALVIAVAHDEYKKLSIESLDSLLMKKGVVIDVKGVCKVKKDMTKAGFSYWRL